MKGETPREPTQLSKQCDMAASVFDLGMSEALKRRGEGGADRNHTGEK